MFPKMLLVTTIPTLLFAVVAVAEYQKQETTVSEAPLKAVVHVNFDDAERQEHGLGNIGNILKDVPQAKIEVVCHGPGITLLQKEKTQHTEKIETLLSQGVTFAACENTMRKKSLSKEDLINGVTTVPSGAVEVLRKQQEGYGYFRP